MVCGKGDLITWADFTAYYTRMWSSIGEEPTDKELWLLGHDLMNMLYDIGHVVHQEPGQTDRWSTLVTTPEMQRIFSLIAKELQRNWSF